MNLTCFYNENHLICINPIRLVCDPNRFTCKECIQSRYDYTNTIQCSNCTNNHRVDLSQIKQDEQDYLNLLNEANINDKHSSLLAYGDKLKTNLISLCENKEALNCVDSLIEHIEFEIDVRVESLKTEIQLLKFKLFTQIDTYNQKKINQVNNDDFEFEQILNTKSNLTIQSYEKNLHKIQHKTSSIEQSLKAVQKLTEKQKKSPDLGSHSMIGYLNSKYNHFNMKKLSKLKLNRTDLIVLNTKSVCGLTDVYYFESFIKNFQLVISDFASNEIKYLQKFDSYTHKDTQITCMNRLNQMRFMNYYSISTNSLTDDNYEYDKQALYVCDMELQRVLVFDLKMTKLKKIIRGKTDTKVEFECPRDICYYDRQIYILDQGTNSIDIFDAENATFVKSFYFNKNKNLIQNAWSIRVGSELIAIIDWMFKICIFDFDFNLIGNIEQTNITSMCFINNNNNNYNNHLLFAHSDNGDFIEQGC